MKKISGVGEGFVQAFADIDSYYWRSPIGYTKVLSHHHFIFPETVITVGL